MKTLVNTLDGRESCHFCNLELEDLQLFSYLKFIKEKNVFECSLCKNYESTSRHQTLRHIKGIHKQQIQGDSLQCVNFQMAVAIK